MRGTKRNEFEDSEDESQIWKMDGDCGGRFLVARHDMQRTKHLSVAERSHCFGCPWGAASTDVNNTGVNTRVCVFRLQSGVTSDSLRIVVAKANKPENAGKEMLPYESKCTSAGSPLKGVGNEAFLCMSNTDKLSGELVVGRVRDNIFTVAIYSNTGNDAAAMKDALADKAEEIAKQVAGILF